MRAVIDTNVVISALFWGGSPRRVVDLAAEGAFQAVTSPALLAELEEVLAEDFGVPVERLDLILRDVLSYAVVVAGGEEDVETQLRDGGDAKVIACAIAGRADFIITGDKDLLALGEIRRVRVVTVRTFLDTHARRAP